MPEKKKKSVSKNESMAEPTIVEVYGDDEKHEALEGQSAINEQFEQQLTSLQEEVSEINETSSDHQDGSDDAASAETLKTEVVGEQALGNESLAEVEVLRSVTDDDKQFDDEIGSQRTAVRSVFGVGLIVFLVIFGLTGWAFYLKTLWLPGDQMPNVLVAEASPSPTPLSTPTPTVEPLSRDAISLEILNGSGVVGLAGKTAQTFKNLGYTSVETGNSAAVTKTQVFIQRDLESKMSILMADLEKTLSVASISGYLKDTDTVSARIVLAQ